MSLRHADDMLMTAESINPCAVATMVPPSCRQPQNSPLDISPYIAPRDSSPIDAFDYVVFDSIALEWSPDPVL